MKPAEMTASPFSIRPDGVRVAVKVTPKASGEAVRGVAVEADGRAYLVVRVTAAAEEGRANAAVIRLLAKRWRLPAGSIQVVSGATARRKVLHLDGAPAALLERLASREGLTPEDPGG
ncbi:MAG TPA: DUF167 family protein [Geminicoccaceae bacterium]|nr:DUF167 family protein [Geminicoccaceae bacterium]